ncbi:MAG: zf-HC2 domain-containing protein [Gemmatimonadota bacterium]|nr:zf-HC2 domain-containing protein [Gemmatimonadota bacterium]
MSCDRFLQSYSEFRDGLLGAAEEGELRAHLEDCPRCARFDRAVRLGVDVLQSMPPECPEEDFLPRLRHRLYNIDEGLAPSSGRLAGGAALAGVAAVGLLALFWIPFAATVPLEMELDPVAARTPAVVESDLPALFRPGPFVSTTALQEAPATDPDGMRWTLALRGEETRAPERALLYQPPRPRGR